ncbi:MAG: hypothetical protein AAGC88_04065 [Bacteroidota bacterium]
MFQIQKSSSYASILLYEVGGKGDLPIVYFDEHGTQKKTHDEIIAKSSKAEKEYIHLASGKSIDVDNIISVDGEPSPQYDQDYFKCDCV